MESFEILGLVASIILAIGVSLIFGLNTREPKKTLSHAKTNKKDGYKKLGQHTQEFDKPEIITLLNGKVHVALGYGLANAILIEGKNACILIDTLESHEAARDVLAEFKKIIKKKPIEGIILTHFHADHSYGFDVFAEAYPGVKVFAHETFSQYFQQLLNVRTQITMKRAVYQFGTALEDEGHENSGIGIRLRFDGSTGASYDVKPTDTFKNELRVTLAGIDLTLFHAPGETNDQIIVWWPEEQVLFPADNIYRAFPNLYAIRGTMARDTLMWVKAVDLMRSLKPKMLVPQHTRPIEGADHIMQILTAYRDAIQIVHDQTVRFMNKGLYPDEIAALVTLPPHLADHPFLQEFYGTVEWSVKAVFCNYMGWFSGKASELHPLGRKDQAEALVDLAGGPARTEEKMKEAFIDGKFQWALQLADALIDSGNAGLKAKDVKINALRQLALGEVSACGRNWYLTEALVEEGLVLKPTPKQVKRRIYSGSLYNLFLLLTVMIDNEKTLDVEEAAKFNFTDVNQHFVLKIRRGVAELLQLTEEDFQEVKADLEVTTTNKVWREILAKDKSGAAAALKGEITCQPGVRKLAAFMDYFDSNQ